MVLQSCAKHGISWSAIVFKGERSCPHRNSQPADIGVQWWKIPEHLWRGVIHQKYTATPNSEPQVRVLAVVSLRTSGPFTPKSWPCPVGMSFRCATGTVWWSPIQLESAHVFSWTDTNLTAQYLWQRRSRWSLDWWDCTFESRWGHGCLLWMLCVVR